MIIPDHGEICVISSMYMKIEMLNALIWILEYLTAYNI